MKRFAKIVISAIIVSSLILSLSGYAFVAGEQMNDNAHTYPVAPGSQEWKEMTLEERLASCAVSQAEVKGMTTSALVETVLNYPYLLNIYAYNSINEGIQMVSSYFPGLPELVSRSDGVEALQAYCNQKAQMQSDNNSDLDVYNAEILIKAISGSVENASSRLTNATLYTPKGSAVSAYIDTTWDDHGITQARADEISNAYLDIYPSAQILRTANPKYNCHSYAWHSTSESNRYWIDNPSPYVTDGSYTSDYASVDHKITYRTIGDNTYIHSGIITSTSGGMITVSSKWGSLSLFSHEHFDCPYLADTVGTSVAINYWE